MISIFSPQNAMFLVRLSNWCLMKSNASTNSSKVQPSRNIYRRMNATTLVDIIGIALLQSKKYCTLTLNKETN